jgi:hypothetical protein
MDENKRVILADSVILPLTDTADQPWQKKIFDALVANYYDLAAAANEDPASWYNDELSVEFWGFAPDKCEAAKFPENKEIQIQSIYVAPSERYDGSSSVHRCIGVERIINERGQIYRCVGVAENIDALSRKFQIEISEQDYSDVATTYRLPTWEMIDRPGGRRLDPLSTFRRIVIEAWRENPTYAVSHFDSVGPGIMTRCMQFDSSSVFDFTGIKVPEYEDGFNLLEFARADERVVAICPSSSWYVRTDEDDFTIYGTNSDRLLMTLMMRPFDE